MHDAVHLSVDLLLLLLVNLPALEGVHHDVLEPAEDAWVVEGMTASLKEVVLDGVVVPDGDKAAASLLTKEGAGMGNDRPIRLDEGACNNDLSVGVTHLHGFLDVLPESCMQILAREILDLSDRVGYAVLDEEVFEGSDRHTVVDLPGIQI